jgi:ABC-type multidrug transport system ATPase subunit
MLIGEIKSTSGQIFINGFNLDKEYSDARYILLCLLVYSILDLKKFLNFERSSLGYCPQFSYLPEFLNVQECLELFADLRGLHRYNTSQILIDLITLFKLERFKNRKIQDLRFYIN